MNTTALLVDILIVGFQVLIWICGFAFSFFISPHTTRHFLSSSPASSLFLIVMISYTLGIIFDYIVAITFSYFKSAKENALYTDVSVVRIMATDKEVHKYLDNQYGRLRIARGTLFNLPLITISFCCIICNFNIGLKVSVCWAIFWTILFGLLFTILSFISWKRRNEIYMGYIEQTKHLPPSRDK